jgi:hypothetical protein
MIVLAHAGHWLVSVLYASPLVIVVGLLAVAAIRDRRRSGGDREGSPETPGA